MGVERHFILAGENPSRRGEGGVGARFIAPWVGLYGRPLSPYRMENCIERSGEERDSEFEGGAFVEDAIKADFASVLLNN